jgi:arginine-tRNA-protein transferase
MLSAMTDAERVRLIGTVPPEVVVHDAEGACAYLPNERWRLPLRMPVRPLSRTELDQRLAVGDRRQGRLLYHTECPGCQACIPIRIDVTDFVPSRTHRRVLARGRRLLTMDIGPLGVTEEKVLLYDRHKRERGLSLDGEPTREEIYGLVLADTCCDSFELCYRLGDELVGVAIVDRAARSLSAVYCYWDPAHSVLSLGTYSILEQIELCRRWGLRYLYLGLYVADCRPMAYKARFVPNEQRHDGRWVRHERSVRET